jgi:serine/threonine protein kinase
MQDSSRQIPGEPTSAKPFAAGGSDSRPPVEASELPISELLRTNSSSNRRVSHADGVAAHLANPALPPAASVPPVEDTDDAPTIITQKRAPATPPPGPYIVGEGPSIAGRRLGHYELIEAIGSGGMAAVLKARDLELGRIVALKILPPAAAHDPETVTRFKQEARAAAKLDHENVARVYFCGEDQGLHFIAFEFVEGVTLRAQIDRKGTLSPAECVRYMIQVAAGLHHAAERGVVHRDIKPSNIIIAAGGRAKIVDMGLARHLESQSVNGGVTQSGVTLGTFDYISPEQALDPRRADVRSDIYSLGCAFYHALTGRPPVPDGTAAKKLYAHQHIDPLDPRELNPAIPDELAAVLARMMVKNPDRRYQSPTELIAHLKAIAAKLRLDLDSVVTDSTIQTVPANEHVLPEIPQVRLGWVIAAAAVVIAVVAIALSAVNPGGGESRPPWAELHTAKIEKPGGDQETKPGPVAPAPAPRTNKPVVEVENAAGLIAAFESAGTGPLQLKLAPGEYDLTQLERPIEFKGTDLDVKGSPPSGVMAPTPTIIRISPRAAASLEASPPLMLAKAASISFTWIRFEVVPGPDAAPVTPIDDSESSLFVFDTAQLHLTDCEFALPGQDRKSRQATVSVIAPSGNPPKLDVKRCVFAPAGIGLRVPPGSEVNIDDSGFGPHTAAIQVRSAEAEPAPATVGPAKVSVNRSSFVLNSTSAVVETAVPAKPEVQVTAGHCLFAQDVANPTIEVPAFLVGSRKGAIIRAQGEVEPYMGVSFKGRDDEPNAYFRVAPLASESRRYSFEECRTLELPAEDAGRRELAQRPWAKPDALTASLNAADPCRAFRLLRIQEPDADPNLFDDVAAARILGARFARDFNTGGRTYPDIYWPPPKPEMVRNLAVKVWVPDAVNEDDLPPNQEKDLVKLLRDAKSGDTILIRHNGVLGVDQCLIEPNKLGNATDRGEFHLTFKPEPGSRPILVPKFSTKLDLSLFRVIEGRVTFENLQFQIKPTQPGYQESVAAVTLVAGRGCTFRNCVFTLQEEDGKVATAVMLSDPDREMKMDALGMRPTPRITFEKCLIRGKGRAVSVPVSRPFALDLEQSLTALYGPVVHTKAGGRDTGTVGPSSIRLSHSTALLGGPVIEVQGGRFGEMRSSGLVPTNITADACLFAAVPGAGRGIVEVDGTELDPMDPNRVIRWERGDSNRFANFDTSAAVVLVRPGDGMIHEWDWNTWISFAREVGRPVGTVTFAGGPTGLKDLATVKAGDVVVKTIDFPDLIDPKPGDVGVDPGVLGQPDEMKEEEE